MATTKGKDKKKRKRKENARAGRRRKGKNMRKVRPGKKNTYKKIK